MATNEKKPEFKEINDRDEDQAREAFRVLWSIAKILDLTEKVPSTYEACDEKDLRYAAFVVGGSMIEKNAAKRAALKADMSVAVSSHLAAALRQAREDLALFDSYPERVRSKMDRSKLETIYVPVADFAPCFVAGTTVETMTLALKDLGYGLVQGRSEHGPRIKVYVETEEERKAREARAAANTAVNGSASV